eukprot:gene11469-23987_t
MNTPLANRTMVYKKTVPRKTKEVNDTVIVLRNAIFTPSGRDKDVTEGIAPQFLTYSRNNLDVRIEFSAKLSRADANWAFDLTKTHMENIYESSGYGWDDEDKMRELTEQGARFLLIRETNPSFPGGLVAFAHFRFTVQGEVMDMMAGEPCLYLWDIQIEKSCQRRGLGRHLITLLELIARREKMSFISVPIQNSDAKAMEWITKIRGFKNDFDLTSLVGFDPENEGFTVMSKNLTIAPRRQGQITEESENTTTMNATDTTTTTTPTKEKTPAGDGVKIFRRSPVSVMDAEILDDHYDDIRKEKPPAIDDPEYNTDDGNLELTGLSEKDVVEGLRILFREKNGREVTDDEVEQWLAAIRDAEGGDLQKTGLEAQE